MSGDEWNILPEDEDMYYNPFQDREEWMTARQQAQLRVQWKAYFRAMQPYDLAVDAALEAEAGEV